MVYYIPCIKNSARRSCAYRLHSEIKFYILRKNSFLITFLNDGNPTTATATRIHQGGNAYSKR